MGMSVIGCHITDMTRGMSGIVGIISRLVADDWTDWDRRIVLDPLHSTPCNNRRTLTRNLGRIPNPRRATWAC